MKTKLFLIAGVAMIASLASCTKDGTSAPTPDAFGTSGTAYAKISISMGPTTRADEVYDAGTKEEAVVEKIALAFYNDYGVYVGKGDLVNDSYNTADPTDPRPTNGDDSKVPSVSDTYNKIFKLDLFEDAEPAYVVAFINTDLNMSNISDFETGVPIDLKADGGKTIFAAGTDSKITNFAMTNSGFYDDEDNWVFATKLNEDTGLKQFYDSVDKAKESGSPANANIFVERLAAKIKVVKDTNMANEPDYLVEDVASNDVKLNFNPEKWAPTGVVTSEWLVKTPFTTHESWNDATNSRSYWAEGQYYRLPFEKYYKDGAVASSNPLTYRVLSDVENMGAVGDVAQYVPEHTTELQVGEDTGKENIIANTYALIVGSYKVEYGTSPKAGASATWFEEGEGTDKVINFYLLLNRMEGDTKVFTIYNKSQLIGLLLDYNGIKEVYETNSEPTEAQTHVTKTVDNSFDFSQYLDLKYNGEGKYILTKITEENGDEKATGLYYKSEEEYVEIMGDSDSKEYEKATSSRNYKFEQGHAYFNALIKHDVEGTTDVYGVVRNHSYILNITKITTLGAPLNGDKYGEDENGEEPPIIPDPDELKDHYIKAEIKVLSWHEKTNDIVL